LSATSPAPSAICTSLAARAGTDPELARRAARSFRNELGPPSVPWPIALDAERAAQMWSLRRRA